MRDDEMMHYTDIGSEYLKHYGILGQRKGRRRWQNEDGSLTPEGYIHYGYGLPDKEKTRERIEDHYRDSDYGYSSNGGRDGNNYSDDYEDYDDYEDFNIYGGDVEGEGNSRYDPDDRADSYTDADYRDMSDIDVKYQEKDDKQSDNGPSLRNTPPRRKTSAKEGFATAAATVAGVANGLTKDQPVYDANGKKQGTIEAPLKTLAKRSHDKKQAAARAANAASIQNMSNAQLQAVIDRRRLENTYLDVTTPEVRSGYEKTMQLITTVGALAGTALTVMSVADQVKKMRG